MKKKENSAEIKLLTAIYATEVFEGSTVHQEQPLCCGKTIDLYAATMSFREIIIGSRRFHLLQPRCPICQKVIQATYSLIC